MLICDCGARPDDENGHVTHEPDCINGDLPADDPSDHYGL